MKQLKQNKKGVELTFQTIVILIIVLITIIVMVAFFSKHFGGNSDTLFNAGSDAILNAKNFT